MKSDALIAEINALSFRKAVELVHEIAKRYPEIVEVLLVGSITIDVPATPSHLPRPDNVKVITLTADQWFEFKKLSRGNKVVLIKQLRELTGIGLWQGMWVAEEIFGMKSTLG